MGSDYSKMSVAEQIRTGLEQTLSHFRGEITLRTTRLLVPPPPAGRRDITRLRKHLKMSQGAFARAMNVSPKTIQSWEQGLRRPSGAALRLIEMIAKGPDSVRTLVSPEFYRRPTRVAKASRRPTPRKLAV
jgi:putative transcriptional regulator